MNVGLNMYQMSWIVDTNLHIHAPIIDSEQAVLEKATRHANLFGNNGVLVDVKKVGSVERCSCGSKEETNFYWVILYHFEV